MDTESSDNIRLVRQRISRFLREQVRSRRPAVEVIRTIEGQPWAAYFFGGFARDLALGSKSARPRDIDIIAPLASAAEIESVLAQWIVRRNRFGGYKLHAGTWEFDIWPAFDTWALREFRHRFQGIPDIPKSTFLNVEAILVSVTRNDSGEREVIDGGFLDAWKSREIELNFDENPEPALCVVRSLYLAQKLSFRIGRRLMEYLAKRRTDTRLASVMAAQLRHYGMPRIPSKVLEEQWSQVALAYHQGNAWFQLPPSRVEQLALWDFEFDAPLFEVEA